MKKIVIIGAGPSGLTAAYELLKKSKEYEVIILEAEKIVGGISKTVTYNGNKMDLGGHRFFTKDQDVFKLWKEILPVETKKEKKDKVLLKRRRVSRIYYHHKFFDYPINLSFKTIKNLGLKTTIISGFSYLKSIFRKLDETSLENFYINRFGKKLYEIFFKDYTEKVWGISPSKLSSSWGVQRVKGISIKEVLKDYFKRLFKIKDKNKQVSLIDEFYYPKYGPGLMYEELASKILKMGGKIYLESKVIGLKKKGNTIESIIYEKDNKINKIEADYIISSMPIKDLIEGMNNVPKNVLNTAKRLPYRDFITVGLVLDKIDIKNDTKYETDNNLIPDTWIYVQSKDVKLGRIQVFNNWSPYLVKNSKTVSLGLEYFCNENDSFWQMDNLKLKEYAFNDLVQMKIINKDTKVIDYHVERVIKAYPAYYGSYEHFDIVKDYLNTIDNLYCIGRNGMHRYNNMDHSMKSAMICVENILLSKKDKNNIWNVNTDSEYHEVKNEKTSEV